MKYSGVNLYSKSKMGNIRTEYNGEMYDSIKEANYARDLDLRLKDVNKELTKWERQVAFPVIINGHKICDYRADFLLTYKGGRQEIIDVKPFDKKTQRFLLKDVYKLKKKMVEAIYNVTIIEA